MLSAGVLPTGHFSCLHVPLWQPAHLSYLHSPPVLVEPLLPLQRVGVPPSPRCCTDDVAAAASGC